MVAAETEDVFIVVGSALVLVELFGVGAAGVGLLAVAVALVAVTARYGGE